MRENRKVGTVFEYSKRREEAIARRRAENINLTSMQGSQPELNSYGTGPIQLTDSISEF